MLLSLESLECLLGKKEVKTPFKFSSFAVSSIVLKCRYERWQPTQVKLHLSVLVNRFGPEPRDIKQESIDNALEAAQQTSKLIMVCRIPRFLTMEEMWGSCTSNSGGNYRFRQTVYLAGSAVSLWTNFPWTTWESLAKVDGSRHACKQSRQQDSYRAIC